MKQKSKEKQFRPKKEIKIPQQLTRKVEKFTLQSMREMETITKKDLLQITQSEKRPTPTSQFYRSLTSRDLQQSYRPITHLNTRSKLAETFIREKKIQIKFKTTGAGFRQRVPSSQPILSEGRSQKHFRRTSVKVKLPATHEQEQGSFALRDYIMTRDSYRKKEKSVIMLRQKNRILFGEKYNFQQKAQYQYSQTFTESDIEWDGQMSKFRKQGFGVDSNLSKFDLASLSDPEGVLFLAEYMGKKGKCPYYSDKKYIWMDVVVVGFDILSDRAIIENLLLNEVKKVSRLSIKFQNSQNQVDGEYWKRIKKAKKLRRQVRQQQKYLRYITNRKQTFNINEVMKLNFGEDMNKIIVNEWYNRYSKQVLIYKQMQLRPQKFKQIGLKIRNFKPFKQKFHIKSYADYQAIRDLIEKKHYTRFPKFIDTLRNIYTRLNIQNCTALIFPSQPIQLQDMENLQCEIVKQTVQKIHKKTRQLILSDIFGDISHHLINKKNQKKYYKLLNFVFLQRITQNLYQQNTRNWLNYLRSFTINNRETPAPIIRMRVCIDKENSQIDIDPPFHTLEKSLLQPVLILQNKIQKIPDLMGDLLLLSVHNKITIQMSLLESCVNTIAQLANFSYSPVFSYCQAMELKLKYLSPIRYKQQSFGAEGKSNYKNLMSELQLDLKEVQHSYLSSSGIFIVNLSEIKITLSEAIQKQKIRLGKMVQRQIIDEGQMMSEQYRKIHDELFYIPKIERELVKMRSYLRKECQDFLTQAMKHYEMCQQFYRLLEDHYFQYNQKQFEKINEMILEQTKLMTRIREKFQQLEKLEKEMIEQINQERDVILKGLDEISAKISIIQRYGNIQKYNQYYVQTSKTYFTIQQYFRQLEDINERERLLSQQISIFPQLNKLKNIIKPFFQLWNNCFELTNDIDRMQEKPIIFLNFHQISQKMSNFIKDNQRLTSFFIKAKNSAAVSICEILREKGEIAKGKLWIIESFTKQGILKKQNIRKEVTNKIFKGQQVVFQEMTLQNLEKNGVNQQKDFVISKAHIAEKIWILEKSIGSIVNEVKKLQFVFSVRENLPYIQQEELEGLVSSTREQIQVMEVIRSQDQAAMIIKKVNSNYNRLTMIEETLITMKQFQKAFFSIKRLMKISEIRVQMQAQTITLTQIQKIWKNMCTLFMRDCMVWECIDSQSYKNRMENSINLIKQIDKKITSVLNSKRLIFPRLFFICDEQLKKILIDNNYKIMSNSMKYLFGGVKNFKYNQDKIIGIDGWQGESINFKNPLCTALIWQKLKILQQQIGKILNWEINFASNKNQKLGIGKAVKKLYQWTIQAQQAISKKKVKILLQMINNKIANLNPDKVTYEDYYLCSIDIYLREKSEELIKMNITQVLDFQWKKQLKFYKTQFGGMELKTLNISINFQNQYNGNTVRPYFLLSDRTVIQSFLCSRNMSNPFIIQNQNCQILCELSQFIMHHYVENRIGITTNCSQLLSLVKGSIFSECWSTLTLKSQLKKEAFSLLAQIMFEVYNCIQSDNFFVDVGGVEMKISKHYKLNLTLNLQNIGQSLVSQKMIPQFQSSFKFRMIYRNIGCINPPETTIMRFKLQSIGIMNSDIEQLFKIYECYQIHLKDQWYFISFNDLMEQFILRYINSKKEEDFQDKNNSFFMQFYTFWKIQLPKDALISLRKWSKKISQIQEIQQINNNYENQKQKLKNIIIDIQMERITIKKILVIGKNLTGKNFTIESIFRSQSINFVKTFEFQEEQVYKWQIIQIQFYKSHLSIQSKVVIIGRDSSYLDPCFISNFIVFSHNIYPSWKSVLKENINLISPNCNQKLKNQMNRQLNLLIQNYFDKEIQKENFGLINSLILSSIKLLKNLIEKGKLPETDITQAKQIIFMTLYWQTQAFKANKQLDPKLFQSCIKHKFFQNYFYDTQKSAWLEWVTTNQTSYFCQQTSNFKDIYLPLKQTVCALYFLSASVGKQNVYIKEENNGIGRSKLIQKAVDSRVYTLQNIFVNKSYNFTSLSRTISKRVSCLKRDGTYHPPLDKKLIICLEDVNLTLREDFIGNTTILCNYYYQPQMKRIIGNTKFILMSHFLNSYKLNENNILENTKKSNITIFYRQPDGQSQQSLFSYYLQWFFGNTQNPFSKQVRDMSNIIVQLSLTLQKKLRSSNQTFSTNLLSFKFFVRLFEGLTKSNPKTVKSSKDIINLWNYEFRQLFLSGQFFKQGRKTFQQISIQFLQNFKEINTQLSQVISRNIKKEDIFFIRLPILKFQYSETYRQVQSQQLKHQISQLIINLELSSLSFYPLIIYETFLVNICRIVRILNTPNGHMMLYGSGQSCKKSMIHLASLITYDNMAVLISNKQEWRETFIQSLGSYNTNQKKDVCFIFSIDWNLPHFQYLEALSQFLQSSQLRSFAYCQDTRYLQKLGFTSLNTKKYKDFVVQCALKIHCFLTLSIFNVQQICNSYPSMIKCMSGITKVHTFDSQNKVHVAKISIGKFFQNYDQIGLLDSIFSSINYPLSNAKFLRLMQRTMHYYNSSITSINKEIEEISSSIQKITKTQKQSNQLEEQLRGLQPKLEKMKIKVSELWKDYQQYKIKCDQMETIYKQHYHEYDLQLDKTNIIREDVDFQLSKVLPMLKSAEDAMAKVTRDDINQLRSFPNPPLPAAKVVESLIFLFNQNHLVKEKVLDGGQKVRDFWQYAKKFILNDKLLKRVGDYKPEVIKDLDKGIIITLKDIIKKPQFIEERVFKASSAAGNLSLWIKAIIAVYDVMQIIDPKKKILNAAEEALQVRKFYLDAELEQLQECLKGLQEKGKVHEKKLGQRDLMQQRINQLERRIKKSKQLLGLLAMKETDWKRQINVQYVQSKKRCQLQALYTSLELQVANSLEEKNKKLFMEQIKKILKDGNQGKYCLLQNEITKSYKERTLQIDRRDELQQDVLPLNSSFLEKIAIVHENMIAGSRIQMVLDGTGILCHYLAKIEVQNIYNLKIQQIDTLSFQDLQKWLISTKGKRQEEMNNDSSPLLEAFKREKSYLYEIVLLRNLEFVTNASQNFALLADFFKQKHILIVTSRLTSEITKIMEMNHLSLSARIQLDHQTVTYCLKKILHFPAHQLQQLTRQSQQLRLKSKLISVLLQQQNILYHDQIIDEWVAMYQNEKKMNKQVKPFKKINKFQEESLIQLIKDTQWKKNMNFIEYLALIKHYVESKIQNNEQAIWTLLQHIKDQIQILTNKNVIHVVYCTSFNKRGNPLAYLYLIYPNLSQLQRVNKLTKLDKKSPDSEHNSLDLIKCEIVSIKGILYAIRNQIQVYMVLSNAYQLVKAMDQCTIIYEQYLKQFQGQEDKKGKPPFRIYLLTNLPEIVMTNRVKMVCFQQQTIKNVVTISFQKESSNYDQLYHMEKYHLKYPLILRQEKQYIYSTLYNTKVCPSFSVRQIYEKIFQLKDKIETRGLALVGVSLVNTGLNSERLCLSGLQFWLSANSKSRESLEIWEVAERILRLLIKK